MMIAASLSRKLLIGCATLAILTMFVHGAIAALTALVPSLVYPGLELWRIISYPLAMAPLSAAWPGIVVAIVAFAMPGEELESILGPRNLGLLLVATTLVTAIVHLVIFFPSNLPMAGPANLGFFVLVGYVYLFPRSEVQLILFRVRGWVVLALLASVVLFDSVARSASAVGVLTVLSNGWLGMILGAAYFHARFQKYSFLLKSIRSMERAASFGRHPADEDELAASSRRSATATAPARVRQPQPKGVVAEISDEERLDMLLEKISEKSYGALSEEEKKFLRDYSGRL